MWAQVRQHGRKQAGIEAQVGLEPSTDSADIRFFGSPSNLSLPSLKPSKLPGNTLLKHRSVISPCRAHCLVGRPVSDA